MRKTSGELRVLAERALSKAGASAAMAAATARHLVRAEEQGLPDELLQTIEALAA